ncbi:MAG: antibiotic biosynthesis monooxygenase [Bacteroidota bacterium]
MNSNIIWTVEGTVKDGQKDAIVALMKEMLVLVEQETGTLNYEWTLSEDAKNLHVYERYKDVEATFAHLGTWAKFAERFTAIVDIDRFTIFSNTSPELREAVAGLQPIYMAPIGGFAR